MPVKNKTISAQEAIVSTKKRVRFAAFLFALLLIVPLVNVARYGILDADNLSKHRNNPIYNDNWESMGRILDRHFSPLAFSKDSSQEDAKDTPRSYPLGECASNVVGYNSPQYSRVGLEDDLAEEIRGFSVPRTPLEAFRLFNKPDRNGDDMVTTLDASLQTEIYNYMVGYRGAAVVIDVKNGDILAMVSLPSYDPNKFGLDGYWARMNSDNEAACLLDRAKQGYYPPGSVFKPLIMAACLEDGITRWNDTFRCDRGFWAGNYFVSCLGDHGNVTLNEALTYSCNAAFGRLGMLMGMSKIRAWMKKFKLDQKMTFVPGAVPARLPESNTVSAPAEAAIGQADILVSPLHMARVAAVIARGGVDIEPRLLRGRIRSTFKGLRTVWTCPEGKQERIISADTASLVALSMRNVVREGTGMAAQIPNVPVAGKTGSAENPHGATHAWFIGYAPAGRPRYAVSVIVENRGGGGVVAAPIAKFILEEALKLKDADPLPAE